MSPKLKAYATLALVFVAGAAAGAGGLIALGPPRPSEPLPGLEELDLSRDQRVRAKAVLERHRPELEAVLADVRPKLETIHEAVATDLEREVLTEAQAKKLRELRAQHKGPPLPR